MSFTTRIHLIINESSTEAILRKIAISRYVNVLLF